MKLPNIRIFYILLFVFGFNEIAPARTDLYYRPTVVTNQNEGGNTANNGYATPQAFWNLYYDFTGNGEAQYPKGKINISQILFQSELKKTVD